MKRDSEPGLLYYPTQALEQLSDTSNLPLSWEEIIQDIDLGQDELKVLLKLGEKCDLGIEEIILLYLRYWENMDGQEIGDRYGISRKVISKRLIKIKNKLRPELVATISPNREEQK